MLYLMRKHAQSWLIKLALGAIIVVFVFWYGYNYNTERGNRIAVVNGSSIELGEYRNVYEQLVETYRSQFGSAFSDELIQSLNLKKQALDQLINQRLFLQEAVRLDFRVTDEELLRSIQQISAFQRDGRFDPELYQRLLSLNRMTPELFEENRKRELLIEELQSFILGSIKVSEAEALETYKWLEEKVSIDYVLFEPSAYEGLEVTPEEIEAYFAENNKAYETPPEVKVKYLRLAFEDFEAEAEVTEEQVQAYFDQNKEDYGTPKQVRASHILFKPGAGNDQEALETARNKALDVLAEARSGKDFAELARQYSDDAGSREGGGDLGFFVRERMVKPFSDAAFAMEVGEISEPVKTPFGWHIIKVEAIQEGKEPVLAEAAEQIRDKLSKDAARSLAFDRSEDVYDACYTAGIIDNAAADYQLEVHETGFFPENGPIEGIENPLKFAEAAFALPENEPGEPLEMAEGYYILQRTASRPASIPELETVKEKVEQDLMEARKEELARGEAETFLSDLKGGAPFEEAAASRELKVQSTDFFGRSGSIPDMGFEQDIQKTAFALSEAEPFVDHALKGRKGYYVIGFKARQEPGAEGFEEKKSQVMSGLLAEKRQRAIDELIEQLREKSEVTIQEGFLD